MVILSLWYLAVNYSFPNYISQIPVNKNIFQQSSTIKTAVVSFSMCYELFWSAHTSQPRLYIILSKHHVCHVCISYHRKWSTECKTESLKGKSSAGYDKIPEFLISHCIHYIKKPLVLILNALFNSGIFPDKWKLL